MRAAFVLLYLIALGVCGLLLLPALDGGRGARLGTYGLLVTASIMAVHVLGNLGRRQLRKNAPSSRG